MLYYFCVACLGFAFHKKVELWGNGFCQPKHALTDRLLRFLLCRADHVGVRDKPSFDIARRYGARCLRLEGDLALGIKKEECRGTPRTNDIIKGIGRYALFALSSRTNEREYELFKLRAKKAREKGISVIAVAMYPKEDSKISLRFAKETCGRYACGLSANELIFLLSKAEFCLSARLHLLIFSKIAGIPFEAIGNDRKLTAFCEENRGLKS